MKRRHDSYAISDVRGRIHAAGSERYPWREGVIVTPLGYVSVYIESPEGRPGLTDFRAIMGGREHWMTVYRAYSDRGAATVAARWIRELHEDAGGEA